MALRSMNHWKQMANGLRQYATSTSPKMKAYAPSVGATEPARQSYNYKKLFKGDFVPVFVALGMITLSVGFGIHTVKQQLMHSPHVFVKKSRRETLPEVVEPEHVVEEADKFIKNSFFRKVAHVQGFGDYNHVLKDPTRGDVFAHYPSDKRKPAVTLKDVGVDPLHPKAA